MELYGIGTPTLRDRIVNAIGGDYDELVSLKTLQRFLADSNRTDDAFVGRCQSFLDILAPQPPVDGIGIAIQKFLIHEDEARYGRKFDLCGFYMCYERFFDVPLHHQIFEKFCTARKGKPPIQPSGYDLFKQTDFEEMEGLVIQLTPIPASVCVGVRQHEISSNVNSVEFINIASQYAEFGDPPHSDIQRNGILIPTSDWASLMIMVGILGIEFYRMQVTKFDPIVLRGILVPSLHPYYTDESGEMRIAWTPPTEIRLEKVAD
ncbi:MAG: hypothetical protein H6843_13955 [Rhodospirillaceae bacterium]|nr:hypothetical protein [Rhodospirillaceae bacterium]